MLILNNLTIFFSDKPEIETRSVKFTVESEHNLDMHTVAAKWSDIPVSFLMRKINYINTWNNFSLEMDLSGTRSLTSHVHANLSCSEVIPNSANTLPMSF